MMRILLKLCIYLLFSCNNFVNCGKVPKFSDEGLFWHITDIHVDQNYSRIGNPLDLCHEDDSIYPDNGLYGNFLCDSPQFLVNVTIDAMKKLEPKPDFIVWTGDNLPHTLVLDPEWNIVFEGINNITQLLKRNFPGVPLFPSIGNHDTFPPNILIPNESTSSIYEDFLTKGGWKDYLDEEARSTFIKGGYYSQLFKSDLRIVSLNTILWYEPNNFTEGLIDPVGQFSWLEEALKNSSKSGEMVYIIGHVPPGYYNRVKYLEKSSPTYHPQYLEAYLQIVKKYASIIAGQLFGHLHLDMFQLFQCDTGVFLSSSILASSVTPWHHNKGDDVSVPVNPSVRLFHYSHHNMLLKDYDQFFLNLTKANNFNSTEGQETVYELLYKFTKLYKVPDLSTTSLSLVFEKLKEDPDVFETFYQFLTAGKESYPCNSYCKAAQLCAISCTSHDEYNFCMESNGNDTLYTCSTSEVDFTKYYFIIFAALLSVFACFAAAFCYGRRYDNGYVRA